VREVLEEKLARILKEFGVDKLGDVLDSEAADVDFDEVYMTAVLDPAKALKRVERLVTELHSKAAATTEASEVLGRQVKHDPESARQVAYHQLPYWTEQMTVSYLREHHAEGGRVEEVGGAYRLTFPDGEQVGPVIFDRRSTDGRADVITLEDSRVRKLLQALVPGVPGAPIPRIYLPGISNLVTGTMALWQVTLESAIDQRRRIFPLFLSDDGRVLRPTASRVWDLLIEPTTASLPFSPVLVVGEDASAVWDRLRGAAEQAGLELYQTLLDEHARAISQEEKTRSEAFEARRRGLKRVGLPQVRDYRLRKLEQEYRAWLEDLAMRRTT